MSGKSATIRLTVAQAVVRHGNVPSVGGALYPVRNQLPLHRGQNEQSMGFAAAAFANYPVRRRFMFCMASAGPGTANLPTAAALAHANRLPIMLLCVDSFLTRLTAPLLQLAAHFGNPPLGVNDAFRAVRRFWDRISHPAQILQSLPAALATLLEPAVCRLNTGRHDLAMVGDAMLGLAALDAAVAGYRAPADWVARAQSGRRAWDAFNAATWPVEAAPTPARMRSAW